MHACCTWFCLEVVRFQFIKSDQQSLSPIKFYTITVLMLAAGLVIAPRPLLHHSTHKQMHTWKRAAHGSAFRSLCSPWGISSEPLRPPIGLTSSPVCFGGINHREIMKWWSSLLINSWFVWKKSHLLFILLVRGIYFPQKNHCQLMIQLLKFLQTWSHCPSRLLQTHLP